MIANEIHPSEVRLPLAALVAEASLAERWGVSLRTVQRWRRAGSAPPFLKLGRRVFYRVEDIEAHEAAMRSPTGGAR